MKEPDEDDYKKLSKVMQYIRNMKDLTLTIERRPKVVGGQLIHSTSRHEESYRCGYEFGKVSYILCVHKTKTQYKKFNGS